MKKRHCVKFCVCQYYDAYNVGLNNICDNARVDFGRHIFGYWQKSTPNSVSSHDDKGPLGPIAEIRQLWRVRHFETGIMYEGRGCCELTESVGF